MVHQYDLDTPTTSLEKAYEGVKSNLNDPVQRTAIVNKALGRDKIQMPVTNDEIISLFNPNAEFVRTYNERQLKEEKMQKKESEKALYNELGQAYEHLLKYDEYKKLHDPLSNYFLTQITLKLVVKGLKT